VPSKLPSLPPSLLPSLCLSPPPALPPDHLFLPDLSLHCRVDNITNQMKIIESTMLQLRQAEQVARGELSSSAITLSDLRVANETQQKRIEELEAKLQQTVEESQKYQERLQELKERCNLLTANADEERNKRLAPPLPLLPA
jgi:FtsZ-binding cell division protein ZapB